MPSRTSTRRRRRCGRGRSPGGRSWSSRTERGAPSITLDEYIDRFRGLRVNRTVGRSPHKPCMLLAVLELAERGAIAASGWRLFVPEGPVLTEAAHLIPFAETHDDRPQNGIALTPTFHRALDARLIAPAPDMKWRVSEVIDRRIPDNAPLLELAGQDVIFHGRRRYRPRKDALEWRVERLRAGPD